MTKTQKRGREEAVMSDGAGKLMLQKSAMCELSCLQPAQPIPHCTPFLVASASIHCLSFGL